MCTFTEAVHITKLQICWPWSLRDRLNLEENTNRLGLNEISFDAKLHHDHDGTFFHSDIKIDQQNFELWCQGL
jgi:hypothetical protein